MQREGGDDGSEHVLVAGPGATAVDADVPQASNVLGVAYGAAAEDWLGGFQAGPERVAVVSVGEYSRSAASARAGADAGRDVVATATGAVETVPDVGDVAAVGTLVNDYLSAWNDDGDTTVFVDDLSVLLEAVDAETAFRFVHVLLSRASATDARVVAGFDTDDQPPHVARTLEVLFDDVRDA